MRHRVYFHLLQPEGQVQGGAAAAHLCPEKSDFLSSHIAPPLRDTGISVVTGRQSTAVGSDSDLSVLNTVTFSNATWGEQTGLSLASVATSQSSPSGPAVLLAVKSSGCRSPACRGTRGGKLSIQLIIPQCYVAPG